MAKESVSTMGQKVRGVNSQGTQYQNTEILVHSPGNSNATFCVKQEANNNNYSLHKVGFMSAYSFLD